MRKVKSIQERMAQIRAAQQSGAYTLCPRCGEATMKPELHTNALSRQYDIMICDLCGICLLYTSFANKSSFISIIEDVRDGCAVVRDLFKAYFCSPNTRCLRDCIILMTATILDLIFLNFTGPEQGTVILK